MKLTRKQLNRILLSLPNPQLVFSGKIPAYFRVPVIEEMCLINDEPIKNEDVRVKELIFYCSTRENDWVLDNLDL